MTTTFITAIAFLLLGAAVTWIIRKLIFEKNSIPLKQYNEISTRFQAFQTAKALADERNNILSAKISELDGKLSSLNTGVEQTKEQLIRVSAIKETLFEEKNNLSQEKGELTRSLEIKTNEVYEAKEKIAKLTIRIENQSALYDQQKQDVQEMSEKLKKDFSLLANSILDEKTQKFSETQQKEMNILLEPLKNNLNEFKQQVERTYKTENEERISLREQVKHMMTLNETLTKEAKSLTLALSGNIKKQGSWGERLLESILDYSGLQKNIQYFLQETEKNEDGGRIIPDVLVKYPDNRSIIIDSKVSLTHYDQLCREENPDTQGILMKSLLHSIRKHIDGLSGKNYAQISNALDTVVMFVPVEAAYITALQSDPDLQEYAYRKNVMLISPSNLLMAMKLVYDMWRKDAINKNAETISEKAGKLYDKLHSFIDNFEKIGTQLEKAHETWTDARKQLNKGRGNVISQAEQMKQLHVKTNKQLTAKLVDQALLEDGIDTEDIIEQQGESTSEDAMHLNQSNL
jgi:DNA recombination protein RmuC